MRSAVYTVLCCTRRCHDGSGDPVLRRLPVIPRGAGDLAGILEEEGLDAEVDLIAVNTAEEAQELRFAGSPTIRVNGEDLFPVPERAEYALGCRMYATPEGLRGVPTTEKLREALAKMDGGGAAEKARRKGKS